MESHLNSTDVVLLENFQYKLPSSHPYVTDRKQSSYFASGSNVYSPNGTRVVRVSINDANGWVDPSSVLFQFTVQNKEPTPAKLLFPISAYGFFRRLRVMCGSTILEDISDYNKVHHLFEIMKSEEERDETDALGFGWRSDEFGFDGAKITSGNANKLAIAGTSQRVVSFKPFCGILNQDKYLPLKYLQGLAFELELVSNFTDAVVSTFGLGATSSEDEFAQANTSDQWEIRDCQIKCQTCTFDNALQNEYDSHMLDGKNLVINYDQVITNNQSLGGANQDISVNVTRACSRLKKLYVTQHRESANDGTGGSIPTYNKYGRKWNFFMHGMGVGTNGQYNGQLESEFQAQIGGKMFPERAQASLSEQFFHFKQCVGKKGSSIIKTEYFENKHVLACDTQKVPALGAGLNSTTGELMNIRLKYPTSMSNSSLPSELTVYLVAESMVEISDSGVIVLG